MSKSNWLGVVAKGLLVIGLVSTVNIATAADEKKLTPAEEGKKIAFDRTKGNCLTCHMIEGGEMSGDIAPPLMAMQARYPDKEKLYDKIWGKPGTELMPESQMIPFGKNKVLTDDEIRKVVEFLYTL